MRRFSLFAKKLSLFIIIFTFFAGNMCFSEEITLTTVMPVPSRIVEGMLISRITLGTEESIIGDGFTAKELSPGEYTIGFEPQFSATPTLICTYKSPPNVQTGPKAQVVSVSQAGAIIATVKLDNHGVMTRTSTGGVTFIAIGPR